MNFMIEQGCFQSVMYLSKLTIKIMNFLMCFPSGIPAVEYVSHKVLRERFRHNENQKEWKKTLCGSSSGYKCCFQFKLGCHHLGCLFHKLPHLMSPSLYAVTEKLVPHLKLPSPSLSTWQLSHFTSHSSFALVLTHFFLSPVAGFNVLCSIFISLLNN